jgi:hypothetical protein
VVDLGRTFGDLKLHYGIEYFRALRRGALGESPAEVQLFVDCAKRLVAVDAELAFAFLKGFDRLRRTLAPGELLVFLEYAERAFAQNRATGIAYMGLELESATTGNCSSPSRSRMALRTPMPSAYRGIIRSSTTRSGCHRTMCPTPPDGVRAVLTEYPDARSADSA